MQRHNGYILIVVLLFLQLVTMLGMYALEAIWAEDRLTLFDMQKIRLSHQLGYLMTNIVQQSKQTQPSCLVQTISSEDLKSEPISWWKNASCAGVFQSIQYYYVVESLGEDSCAHIKQSRSIAADYYRITLLGLDNNNGAKQLLQSTVVKAALQSHLCDGAVHLVDAGMQSLHALV
jgi:Tfp pilus assembly protein PilX